MISMYSQIASSRPKLFTDARVAHLRAISASIDRA